jgi:hypothetical protein
MGDLFEPQAVQVCAQIFESAASPMDALNAWNREKESRS